MGLEEKRGEILIMADKILDILSDDYNTKLRYDETIPTLLQTLGDNLPISKARKLKLFVKVLSTLV